MDYLKLQSLNGAEIMNQFTVNAKPKSELIEVEKKKKGRTSIGLTIIKWIFTFLLFFGILFCLIGSKISILLLSKRLNKASFSTSPRTCKDKNCTSETAFVMLIFIMMIPHGVTFLRVLINSAISSEELKPKKTAILWGIFSAIFEVIGISMFTLVIFTLAENPIHAILFMNGIFILQAFRQLIKSFIKKPCDLTNTVLYAVAIFSGIGGYAYVIYLSKSTILRISLPICVLFLSLAWSSKIFQLQTQSKNQETIYANNINSNTTNNKMSNNQADLILSNSISISDDLSERSGRNLVTLVSSAVKLILTPLVAFFINYFFGITDFKNPGDSFKQGYIFFSSDHSLSLFITNVVTSFVGFFLCYLACSMNLQKICFFVPLLISTPISICLVLVGNTFIFKGFDDFKNSTDKLPTTVAIWALLWFSQVLAINIQMFKSQEFLMAREQSLFWLPTYNACLLEQHILYNRKNEATDEDQLNYHEIVKESQIFICTTMYHEADYEMEQLLQSLSRIDQASSYCKRQFEAHIFFDDGVRGDVVKVYALQLLSLLKETMGIDPGKACKLETPYGLQLKWRLPNGMPFIIHLKDTVKVKSKKRWSQVMYMSYILDFKVKQSNKSDDLTYILATDADVMFTPDDVMALMDFMSRNAKVGAVCGRTHPLGSGPLVWYQIFDYAIGHWLLKVADHVFGTVLCSPGCFSVYRAAAVRDILPHYATGVNCAMDFLMKDMGEDRWFCTLMIEAGWKLEYCATAENSTYCPDNFDEFFKQRRRWGPSTLANSMVVINEQKRLRENNNAINLFFIAYQGVLLVSSVIGPSTVLMVVAGGLEYAYPYTVNMVVVLILLIVVTVLYTLVCLYCSQDTQLKCSKLLTLMFAIIMSIAIVGIIRQIVDDVALYITPPTPSPPPPTQITNVTAPPTNTTQNPYILRNPYIFNPSTWYMFIISAIFILTAILHGSEAAYVFHGIWYLLCLPSGYLLLTIYSVCNLTDRSWGTREVKSQSQVGDKSIIDQIKYYFKSIFWCCIPPHLRVGQPKNNEKGDKSNPTSETQEDETEDPDDDKMEDTQILEIQEDEILSDDSNKEKIDYTQVVQIKKDYDQPEKKSILKTKTEEFKSKPIKKFRFPGQPKDKGVKFSGSMPHLRSSSLVEDWLPSEYKCYIDNFKNHGYDNVSFIAGCIKEKDLISIGIVNHGHRKRLMHVIESLPPEELLQEIPENVQEWLTNIGLEEYWGKFFENSYTEPRDLADIKYLSREEIMSLFQIKKEGHIRRLLKATSVLQYPTKAQTRIREARKAIMSEVTRNLKEDNADDGAEFEFWDTLRSICLLPEQAAFNSSGELVEKLSDLRDTTLLVMGIANVLWLTFMVTVMNQGKSLNLIGTSFASLAFLAVYSIVLLLQFVAMVFHRLEAALHYIARAPFKPGHFKSNWSWRDDDLPAPPKPEELERVRRKRRRFTNDSNSSAGPLIFNPEHSSFN